MLIQLSNGHVINPETVIFIASKKGPDEKPYSYRVVTPFDMEVTTIKPDEMEKVMLLASTPMTIIRTKEYRVVDGTLHRRHAMLLAGRYSGTDLSSDFGHMLECLKGDVTMAAQENCPGFVRSKTLTDVADLRGDQEFDRFTDDGREVLGDILQDGVLVGSSLSMRQKAKLILDKWNEIFDDLPF